MDDYLLILLGKLRTDRIKLQRELQSAAPAAEFPDESTRTARPSRRARWFNADAEGVAAQWRDSP